MQPEEITAYAKEVAEKLGESEDAPLQQIKLIIEHAGRDFVEENLAETSKIEEEGGMMTEDKKRRRTPGGVFFYIVKGKLDADVRQIIFPNYGQRDRGEIVEWDDRLEHLGPLIEAESAGNMRYVTITLHGRPGDVAILDNSVMTTIVHRHKQTPLPRGVPHPPEDGTLYTVYMSIKHWEDVQETIQKYKHDRLIVEGTAFLDMETESIAVFASQVTTRQLEKEARRAEREDATVAPAKPRPTKAVPPKPPAVSLNLPDGTPPELGTKLRQLHQAAETLRARIALMEEKGQPGISMTRKLLRNTEKQIEALERQLAES